MRDRDAGTTGRDSEPAAGPSVGETPGAHQLAPGYAIRIALFFTALFLVTGVKVPYLPVWLDWRGLSGTEIATIMSAPLFLRLVAGPLIAMAADWSGDRRRSAILLAWLSVAGLLLLSQVSGFWPILVVVVTMALVSTGIMPLAETLAMSGVRLGELDYGRMRLWGSLSFIAAGFVAGIAVEKLGAGSVVWLLVASAAVTAAIGHALPMEAGTGATSSKPRFSFQDAKALVLDRRFLLFLLAAGAVQASHAVFYTFGVIEWRKQGLSPAWAGVLWAIGVSVEIVLFAFSRHAVERAGAAGLIIAGGAAGVVRWTAMAFDPPLWALMPLQALHGFTFGATHLGALHVMARLVPAAAGGTAQALYASVTSGIGLGLATLATGPAYAAFGGRAYLAMTVVAAIGLAASLALRRTVRT